MAEHVYHPQTKVSWTDNNVAYSQFKTWRKEVERILGGPLAEESDSVKLNHVYIWAGAKAETLIEARQDEDPELKITTPKELLDQLSSCLKHANHFREAREEFYALKQKQTESTTAYFGRIMDLYRQADFPGDTQFLITDKLIHGCVNTECKHKLMMEERELSVKECLTVMRQHEANAATMRKLRPTEKTIPPPVHREPTKTARIRHLRSKPQTGLASFGSGGSSDTCYWCNGGIHERERCPARSAQCSFCNKLGHFRKACQKRQLPTQTPDEPVSDDDCCKYENVSGICDY